MGNDCNIRSLPQSKVISSDFYGKSGIYFKLLRNITFSYDGDGKLWEMKYV